MSGLSIGLEGEFGGFLQSLMSAGSVTEREVRRMQNQFSSLTRFIQEQERVQRSAQAAVADQAKVTQSVERITGQAKAASISVGQMNNALRNTPAQLTDIVTQLAGGQSPFLIMIQQGGQMRDMFGGFGNMFRGLATIITPAAVAVGGVGLALGGLSYAYIQGQREQEALSKAMLLTGNYAGQTSGMFNELAQSVSQGGKIGLGAARELNQALVQSGEFGPRLLEPTALAMARLQGVSGATSEEMVKDFARMREGVAKWADEHNQRWHFLTAAQYDYIKRLEEAGKAEQAQLEVSKALYQHLGGNAPDSLGYLQKAWKTLGETIAQAWDAAKSWGRAATPDDQIASLKKSIAANQQLIADLKETGKAGQIDNSAAIAVASARMEAQQLQLAHAQEIKLREDAAARTAANRQAYEEQLIKSKKVTDKLADEAKGVKAVTRELEAYRREVDRLRGTQFAVSPEEQARVEASIKKKYANPDDKRGEDAIKSRISALQEEDARIKTEIQNFQAYGKAINDSRVATLGLEIAAGRFKGAPPQLLEQAKRDAALADADAKRLALLQKAEEERKKAQAREEAYTKSKAEHTLQIDKEIASMQAEVSLIGHSSEEREIAINAIKVHAQAESMLAQHAERAGDIQEWEAEQIKKVTDAIKAKNEASRDPGTGVANALAKYKEDAENMAKYSETMVSGGLGKLEDEIVSFVHTGKLSFQSLWTFMADEFIRQRMRMAISAAMSAPAGGGVGSFFGSLFGAGGAGGAGSAGAAAGASGGGAALFTEVPMLAANGYDYVPRDNMPFLLHQGERVLTAAENREFNAAQQPVVQNISIGAGVSRADVYAAIVQANQALKMEILSSKAHRGAFA